MTLPPTTIAGSYRIEALLGRGGMGEVYRATDQRLGRPVALKLVAPELAGAPGVRERFLAESRLAASLDHPHIVPIYEAGEADGRLYLAMRYVDGARPGGAGPPGDVYDRARGPPVAGHRRGARPSRRAGRLAEAAAGPSCLPGRSRRDRRARRPGPSGRRGCCRA